MFLRVRLSHSLLSLHLSVCLSPPSSFKPVYTRLQELTLQKFVLTKLYHAGLREHQEVRQLMHAMTGTAVSSAASSIKDGVRLLPHGMKALFRAGVIAVLAARRLVQGSRRSNAFGQMIQVRGEQFSL